MDYQFKNLVFEGGGVLGTAYLGAAQILDEKGILKNIQRVGGTSAGAIYAVIMGLNYSLTETTEILWKMNFNKFMDSSFGIVRNTSRLLNEFGWYKGDYFLSWIKDIIKQKTGSPVTTFAQLEQLKQQQGFRSIYLIGSNLSTGFTEVFSAATTPNMPIAEAVRISMSIPLFFASRKVNGDTYVDGGTQLNYPVKLFDRRQYLSTNNYIETDYYQPLNTGAEGNYQVDYVYDKETLGFKLSSKDEINVFWHKQPPVHTKIDDIFDYLKQLVGAVMNIQADVHLHSDDWARSIYIDTLGISAIDFDLTDNDKRQLVEAGKQGTINYFNWFDNQ